MPTATASAGQCAVLSLCPRTLMIVFAAGVMTLLAACGGDAGDTSFDESGAGAVYYSYPYDGQQAVSPHAPMVLRFSDPVVVASDNVILYECAAAASRCDGSNQVATVPLAAPHSTGNGRGVVLAPEVGSLKTGTTYSLVLKDLRVDGDRVSLPNGSLAFRTRVAGRGPLRDLVPVPELAIRGSVPDGDLPLVDFSTVRVRFNQPLDTQTVAQIRAGAGVPGAPGSGLPVPETGSPHL